MQKLEVDQSELVSQFKGASPEIKEKLNSLFKKDVFAKGDITERVNSWLDVLDLAEITEDQNTLLSYAGTDRKMIGAKNFMCAEIIAEVFNEGWIPDYTNTDQPKWFGVFDGRRGFAFSRSNYGTWIAYSVCGSRLCFREEKLLLHAVKIFPDVYKYIMQK